MKKDAGNIHRLFSLLLLIWISMCLSVVFIVIKAGYVDQYLEDSLMQANLAAILVDPYQYGRTGELIFDDVNQIKTIFEESINASLENVQKLGIEEAAKVLDFRLYEVREDGVLEMICMADIPEVSFYDVGTLVEAPDGTRIVSSTIYAKISVPIRFGFGIQIISTKEHCVDVMVSEENKYAEI